jgi:hypothetical protein
MADIESNIDININTAGALQSIKALQREISAFHSSMATNGAAANVQASQMQSRLVNNINATGKFSAQMKTIAPWESTFVMRGHLQKLLDHNSRVSLQP